MRDQSWTSFSARAIRRGFALQLALRLSLCALPVLVGACSSAAAPHPLPPGGTTAWEIRGPEEIVTFVLFDPRWPGVRLPSGLRFLPARDVQMPEVQEHLRAHPEQAEWAFSFVEITREDEFVLDGRALSLPENGGIGLWFAPVDFSQLAASLAADDFESVLAPAEGAVLALGLWIPDRDYVAYMRERGHHAEFGLVTLAGDDTSGFQGEIQLDDLRVQVAARPRSGFEQDPESGTQVLFAPGTEITSAVVLAGPPGRHRACDAQWSKTGDHPLARGVFVGPTYLTVYESPLQGSAYALRAAREP